MSKSKALEALDDIFGVVQDGSNIVKKDSEESHDSSYADAVTEDDASFEDKADVVKQAIEPSDEGQVEYGDKPDDTEQEPSSESEADHEGQASPQEETTTTVAESPVSSETTEPAPTEQVEQSEEATDSADESRDEKEHDMEVRPDDSDVSPPKEEVKTSPKQKQTIDELETNGWLVTCPSPMWQEFYDRKINALQRYVAGREIPFGKFYKELKTAYVDIRVSMSDHNAIASKMQEIQQCRDRVTQIRAQVNSQYYLWKRLVPLFEGLVAMVKYEKPAAKQEGVIYDRMHDMIEYFNKLETMHDTSKDILANLDAAYDSLSRQVTMSMPQKTIERHEGGSGSVQSPKLSDFDSIENKPQKGVNTSSSQGQKSIDKKTNGAVEIDW